MGRPLLEVPFATGRLYSARIQKKQTRFFWMERNAQASIKSARQGRAWFVKARLGNAVVLGMESELDDISHRGGLKETNCQPMVQHNDNFLTMYDGSNIRPAVLLLTLI